ncbi:hypothetical protein [Lacrimispora sphenoides]|uniref:Uncharacterized protein n=1 Tax=Lacrimispora sphenoides JCM 1415 TaxID=1297793 RepID=A0ABY1C6A3_9FIRM|nr:hypothetical protein [Lacrimispora sphenoides]SET73627.1 hypothetical protein SAMN02745906_1507 [[Clostridium] sphenoides JCM 1415]SUY50869.1 Uncharacterised protein [Lacrimispora sphenoides]
MARPKKITENIIPIIDEYWLERCDRNPQKLKYAMIASYLEENGLSIKEYDLRRNKEVANYIKELKGSNQIVQSLDNNTVVFQSLDINDFLKRNNDIYSLRSALAERDAYYSDICDYAVDNIKKAQFATKELKKSREINSKNEKKIEQLHNTQNELLEENQKFKKKLETMLNVLKVHVYPEIANELLRKNRLLDGGDQIISPKGFKNVIQDQDSILMAIKKNEENKTNFSVLNDLFDKI